MSRIRDPKRTIKDRVPQDWALWVQHWRKGAADRKSGVGLRRENDNRLTWAQTAYLSGYIYGREPDKKLYERAWEWMDKPDPDDRLSGVQADHASEELAGE